MSEDSVPLGVLERLSDDLDDLTPEARKAARYVLENPRDAGMLTVREIADAAKVKPNTLVRMARQIGFDGYEDFREPLREAIRSGQASPPDRARWLQDMQRGGGLSHLYGEMIADALENIDATFANISKDELEAAARLIWNSRDVYTMGVGVNSGIANVFTYLARTCMVQFHAIPRPGSTATDDIAWADRRDVMIAMTSHPYRTEVVEAVAQAKRQGMTIIALSDSPASPIIRAADHGFVLSVNTSQFFPSSVTSVLLLETLLSFVISVATEKVVDRADTFHERRRQLGFYVEDQP
ncbi:MurR/RpiR family transcriptional regulator [Tateyamaria sp. SN6-1]|uniref:MurR/RpiR family transcriptional regulator n=1 Tax=Tateyamaria sp. SN6-1 TaxID=3092148 RepID=UPI0039F4A3AA